MATSVGAAAAACACARLALPPPDTARLASFRCTCAPGTQGTVEWVYILVARAYGRSQLASAHALSQLLESRARVSGLTSIVFRCLTSPTSASAPFSTCHTIRHPTF